MRKEICLNWWMRVLFARCFLYRMEACLIEEVKVCVSDGRTRPRRVRCLTPTVPPLSLPPSFLLNPLQYPTFYMHPLFNNQGTIFSSKNHHVKVVGPFSFYIYHSVHLPPSLTPPPPPPPPPNWVFSCCAHSSSPQPLRSDPGNMR